MINPKMESKLETETPHSTITEVEGDLFDAPDNAALIHACNCQGAWGAGIAKVFKKKYPAAFKIYNDYCRKYLDKREYLDLEFITRFSTNERLMDRKIRWPEGTALIIAPQREDYGYEKGQETDEKRNHDKTEEQSQEQAQDHDQGDDKGRKHWIICLFTSRRYGRNLGSVDVILQNTELAIENMKDQLKEMQERGEASPAELRACRFNSGLFGVDWALTKEILERSELEATVVRPVEE
ncbi:hypothetical protein BDV18DRAFT_131747 [Aspergillus unguis]